MDLLNRQRGNQANKGPASPGGRDPAQKQEPLPGPLDLNQLKNTTHQSKSAGPQSKSETTSREQRRDFQERIHPARQRESTKANGPSRERRREDDRREEKRHKHDRELKKQQDAEKQEQQANLADRADDRIAVRGSQLSQVNANRVAKGLGITDIGRLDPASAEALEREQTAARDPTISSAAQEPILGVAPQEGSPAATSTSVSGTDLSQSQAIEFRVHRFGFAERGLANTPWMQELYRFFSNSERDVLDEEERERAERAMLEFDKLSPSERTPEKILEILQLSGVAAPTYQRIGEILKEMGAEAPASQEKVGARALSVLENKDKMERIVFDPSNN